MQHRPVFPAQLEEAPAASPIPGIDLDALIAIARRQWRLVAMVIVGCLILGGCYLVTAVPRYTAVTSVMIDRGNSDVVEQLSALGGVVDDEASILSQVELLKSQTIAQSVVDRLKLVDNGAFMKGGGNPALAAFAMAKSLLNPAHWFGSGEDLVADPAEAKRRVAIGKLLDALTVSRIGRSYVLQISITATSPQLAAVIAGAVADAYLTDKLDAKYDATKRAGEWLQTRIEELRQRSLESDLAVQKFRAANGLVVAGDKLMSDQQLTELNSALIVARADTARAQARYDRIQSILASGETDAIVTDALESSVINTLREKYLDASKREADISKRLGSGHVQAMRLRQEMAEYKRLMFDELGRIAESYQSELDVAQSRERQLRDGVDKATTASFAASETQVQLRELERSAETYKNLYQTFMQRYQEALQQQSFPVTEARIISRAVPPTVPSEPRAVLVFALCIVFGSLIGGGLAAYREFRDRFFRTGEQVRDVLALEYLGAVPVVRAPAAGRGADKAEDEDETLFRRNGVIDFAVDHPLSSFAETLRSAKLAADFNIHKGQRVIGVVSALPGEGKSTIAINLAQILAQTARTILIDADLRNPGATRSLDQQPEEGLLEVLLENRPMSSMLLTDTVSGLKFLPSVIRRRVPHSSELLSSPQMTRVLMQASHEFDYVVLDLPPLGPVVDARAISGRIDGFVMVVEWGRTSRKVVRETLDAEPQIAGRCLGVVLNKVDSERMKLYREYGSSDYYASRYSSYYQDNAG